MIRPGWSKKRGRFYPRADLRDRFWKKVKLGAKDACWPWQAGTNVGGYGRFQMGRDDRNVGNVQLAHRVAFFLIHGKWPSAFATHECDNPPCCNPKHLVDATAKKNAMDMAKRGRVRGGARPGEENHSSKLSEIDVRLIRKLLAGNSAATLSRKFGVSSTLIRKIARRELWRHT